MWLHQYPNHNVIPLRGNINTRLQKLIDDPACDAALFALAGVKRIQLNIPHGIPQDWMLPAPAQGAVCVVCRSNDPEMQAALQSINHAETALCTQVEKDFLRTLQGGCSTPIGTLAQVVAGKIHFTGAVYSTDGKHKIAVQHTADLDHPNLGVVAAHQALAQGAKELL